MDQESLIPISFMCNIRIQLKYRKSFSIYIQYNKANSRKIDKVYKAFQNFLCMGFVFDVEEAATVDELQGFLAEETLHDKQRNNET